MCISNCSLLLIYLPRKDERLSRPGWLTYSGRFTHISGHPSAAGRAQDRERAQVKDRRSTNCATQPTSYLHGTVVCHWQRLAVDTNVMVMWVSLGEGRGAQGSTFGRRARAPAGYGAVMMHLHEVYFLVPSNLLYNRQLLDGYSKTAACYDRAGVYITASTRGAVLKTNARNDGAASTDRGVQPLASTGVTDTCTRRRSSAPQG